MGGIANASDVQRSVGLSARALTRQEKEVRLGTGHAECRCVKEGGKRKVTEKGSEQTSDTIGPCLKTITLQT